MLLASKIARANEKRFNIKGRVHFNVGGAQAVEDALKLVRNYTGKNLLLPLWAATTAEQSAHPALHQATDTENISDTLETVLILYRFLIVSDATMAKMRRLQFLLR